MIPSLVILTMAKAVKGYRWEVFTSLLRVDASACYVYVPAMEGGLRWPVNEILKCCLPRCSRACQSWLWNLSLLGVVVGEEMI